MALLTSEIVAAEYDEGDISVALEEDEEWFDSNGSDDDTDDRMSVDSSNSSLDFHIDEDMTEGSAPSGDGDERMRCENCQREHVEALRNVSIWR